MKSLARIAALSAAAALVAGCSALGLEEDYIGGPPPPPAEAVGLADAPGPAGDYPVVIGPAYVIDGVTHTPDDSLNYDVVGYAIRDGDAGPGVTAAHHTLPLPSYVEVTELVDGRTALVRVERRGPMDSNRLLALSPDAMAQLGILESAPVRVRRVNPPEAERAMLRMRERAPLRIDTPDGLLTVLRRKLPEPPNLVGIRPAPVPAPSATPTPTPTPVAVIEVDALVGYFVQAGAYSDRLRAERVATGIDGTVFPTGELWRVRTGPFATMEAAERDLARVRAAGFGDARVVRED